MNVPLSQGERALGFSQFTTSTDSRALLRRPGVESRRVEGESSECHSDLHNSLRFVLRVFLARSHRSPAFVGISPLSQLSPDFSLATSVELGKINVPKPGSPLRAH